MHGNVWMNECQLPINKRNQMSEGMNVNEWVNEHRGINEWMSMNECQSMNVGQ